jgi:hypothetical protein
MSYDEIETLREFIVLVRDGEWFGDLGEESCRIMEEAIARQARLNYAFGSDT